MTKSLDVNPICAPKPVVWPRGRGAKRGPLHVSGSWFVCLCHGGWARSLTFFFSIQDLLRFYDLSIERCPFMKCHVLTEEDLVMDIGFYLKLFSVDMCFEHVTHTPGTNFTRHKRVFSEKNYPATTARCHPVCLGRDKHSHHFLSILPELAPPCKSKRTWVCMV